MAARERPPIMLRLSRPAAATEPAAAAEPEEPARRSTRPRKCAARKTAQTSPTNRVEKSTPAPRTRKTLPRVAKGNVPAPAAPSRPHRSGLEGSTFLLPESELKIKSMHLMMSSRIRTLILLEENERDRGNPNVLRPIRKLMEVARGHIEDLFEPLQNCVDAQDERIVFGRGHSAPTTPRYNFPPDAIPAKGALKQAQDKSQFESPIETLAERQQRLSQPARRAQHVPARPGLHIGHRNWDETQAILRAMEEENDLHSPPPRRQSAVLRRRSPFHDDTIRPSTAPNRPVLPFGQTETREQRLRRQAREEREFSASSILQNGESGLTVPVSTVPQRGLSAQELENIRLAAMSVQGQAQEEEEIAAAIREDRRRRHQH